MFTSNGAVDHDSIKMGRSDGTYRAIQLRVSGGAVNFDRVIVRYGNGTIEEIQVRSRFPMAAGPALSTCLATAASFRASTFGTAKTGGPGGRR